MKTTAQAARAEELGTADTGTMMDDIVQTVKHSAYISAIAYLLCLQQLRLQGLESLVQQRRGGPAAADPEKGM